LNKPNVGVSLAMAVAARSAASRCSRILGGGAEQIGSTMALSQTRHTDLLTTIFLHKVGPILGSQFC
jgi:hypothetical protein